MGKGDFWNLVGRAGRLAHEFQGNVFCVFGKKWAPDIVSDRLVPIESAFHVAITERIDELVGVAEKPPESAESKELAWAEQAYARIYAEFVASGRRMFDPADAARDPRLAQLDAVSESFTRTLPDELYTNNFYMHPARIESLASALRANENLSAWSLLSPKAPGSYDRLARVYKLIEDLFIKSGFNLYKYHAYLSIRWMSGASLRDLVANKIEYDKAKGVDAINKSIRKLFEDIEKFLRFRYVKYTRLYNDVLRSVMLERGLTSLAEGLLPFHLFLEYGASSQTLINLMALGLSRTSALLFKEYVTIGDNASLRDCEAMIERVNLDRTNLPAICKAEIARLRRTHV